jgi:sugar lactone lactonase YvrE
MRRHVSIAVLAAVVLTACPRSNPVTPKTGSTKGKTGVTSVKSVSSPSPVPSGEDVLLAPTGDSTEMAGRISIDAAYAVAAGAAQLISDQGGGIISDNGAGLIANNGSSLVANNGGNLVGHDPAGITSHLGAGLTGKVKLISNNGGGIISDNGSGLVSNNGGGLVSNNGGGLTGKTKWGLLEAAATPTHEALPVGGLLVGIQSLSDGAYLPLGVDRAGKPVYAIYTDAKGGFKAHLPAKVAHNVLVVASFANTKDTRLAVDLLARPVSAADLQVDDGTTVITSYLRRTLISRVSEVVDPDPCAPQANLNSLSGDAIALGVGLYQDLLAGATFKALPRPARQRVLIRFVDALISQLDVENTQIAPSLRPRAKATGPAMPALKKFLSTAEAAAAERLQADPTYFDDKLYIKLAALEHPGQPPVQIRKPTDLSEFVVDEFLATNDLKKTDRALAIMVDLGLSAQLFEDMAVAGASLIAAMVPLFSGEESTQLVRAAITAAIADEAGTPPSAEPSCAAMPRPPAPGATPALFAGTGTAGAADGPAASAQFDGPTRLVVDPAGFLLVSETGGDRIRKIDLNDPTHPVTTLAGSGTAGTKDGPAASAQFNDPCGLALDGKGALYVAERGGHRIRKIADYATDHAVVSTLAGSGTAGYADGSGTAAQFNGPQDLAFGPDGNLYVADSDNNRIRKIDPAGGVTTLAGDGKQSTLDGLGTEAETRQPRAILLAPGGFFVTADTHDSVLRRLTTTGGLTTLAGGAGSGDVDGTFWSASFDDPLGLAAGPDGTLYVADASAGAIRVLDPRGFVGTLATLGPKSVEGLALGPDGTLYVADPKHHKLQALKP